MATSQTDQHHDEELPADASGDEVPEGIALGGQDRDQSRRQGEMDAFAEGVGDDATARLERVRDLLFGEQVRRHNQRFEHIETYVEHEMAELRSALDHRLIALEKMVRQETDALRTRLDHEQERAVAQLREENDAFRMRLGEQQDALGRRLEERQDTLSRRLDEHRDHFDERLKEQNDQLDVRFDEHRAGIVGQLTEQANADQDALRQHLDDQIESLTLRMEEGQATFHDRLLAERDNLAQRLAEGHNQQTESLEKLARAVRNLAKTTQAAREEMARRVEAQLGELHQLVQRSVAEARNEAAARHDLANWLEEVSRRLRAEKGNEEGTKTTSLAIRPALNQESSPEAEPPAEEEAAEVVHTEPDSAAEPS